VEKSGVLESKSGNISETHKDMGKITLLLTAYRKYKKTHQCSFDGTIPDPLRPPLVWAMGIASDRPNFG